MKQPGCDTIGSVGALGTGAQIPYVEVAAATPLQLTCARQNGVLREQGIWIFYAISSFLNVDNELKSKANKGPCNYANHKRILPVRFASWSTSWQPLTLPVLSANLSTLHGSWIPHGAQFIWGPKCMSR